MRLRCPNCRTDLDIVPVEAAVEVKCPSCGSMVDISGSQETITYTPPRLGQLAHFELIEHIGRGHFGDVYKANDSRLERIVALKVPRSADLGLMEREAFFREARTAARLRHPNIVTVHDVNSSGDTIYIASEFIDGVNLADRLLGKPMEPRKAAELAAQVAEALQHAHEQGVIHRDLKPRNIMLDAAGQPHLLDFGLAKQDATEFTITTEGEILGTPAYMAPEQARGEARSADARTDVYSLGVTLYEILTGTRPFLGDTRGLIYQILNEEPAPPRKLEKTIPRDLETICLKAMAKEPGRRYPTAGEMAADLKRFLAGDPIVARRAGVVERSWRWCRKNPAWCAAGGLGTAALMLLGALIVSAAWPGPSRRHVEIDVRLAQGTFAMDQDPRTTSSIRMVFWPLDREGNAVLERPTRATAIPPIQVLLEPGEYLVVAVDERTKRFHEVFRRVPAPDEQLGGTYRHEKWKQRLGGVIQLADITLPAVDVASKMVYFPGSADFAMGDNVSSETPAHRRRVGPFYLDPREVSVSEFKQSPIGGLPPLLRSAAGDDALVSVDFDQVLAWAECAGKILPTETQFEFAATNGGTQQFPWGDDPSVITAWPLGKVGEAVYDRTHTVPPVVGLYSNVAEWTATWMQFYPRVKSAGLPPPYEPRDYRVIRGAPSSVILETKATNDWNVGPRHRVMGARASKWISVGFRCARSAEPRLEAADFESVLQSERSEKAKAERD